MSRFNLFDYTVISSYMIGIMTLGLIFSRRQKSLTEYYHAGGNMPWWAIGVSMLATTLSPVTYLASPGWIFAKDTRMAIGSLLVGAVAIPLAAMIWLPLWSRLRVMSIYEYLELRYNPFIRTIGAFLFLLDMIFWVGTALITAALGFEHVTGIDGRLCLVFITVLGAAYTVMGGMRAVIWTDVIQFGVFIVGYGAIVLQLLNQFDWRPMQVYEIASSTISAQTGYRHTKLISFEFDLAVEAGFWVIIFSRITWAVQFGTRQLIVQRLHATANWREMLKSMLGTYLCLFLFLVMAIPASWGFVAFYAQHPELKEAITHPDQVLPDFVLREVPHLLRSLVMAGVLAALMSTLDSAINSMSNVAVSDFYRRFVTRRPSEEHVVRVARILAVFFALAILLFSLWQFDPQGATGLEKLGRLLNLIIPPISTFFLLGILSKRTNTPGVLIGALAGLSFVLVFNGFPGLLEPRLEGINWMWIPGLGILVSVVVGYVASFAFPPPSRGSLAPGR